MTSPVLPRDVQLTNHRRQLSVDSTFSLQSSLLLANADDVELNRFSSRQHVSGASRSPLTSANGSETNDSNLLVQQHGDDNSSLLHVSSPPAAAAAVSEEDEDRVSAPDEPLLSNAFCTAPHCKYL